MVIVNLAMASICFMGSCYPALVGSNTPVGTFSLARQTTLEPGYGGDLLVYQEGITTLWAIHRVYTINHNEHRLDRLRGNRVDQRRAVTRGCINVLPEVYEKLVDCCSKDVLIIS